MNPQFTTLGLKILIKGPINISLLVYIFYNVNTRCETFNISGCIGPLLTMLQINQQECFKAILDLQAHSIICDKIPWFVWYLIHWISQREIVMKNDVYLGKKIVSISAITSEIMSSFAFMKEASLFDILNTFSMHRNKKTKTKNTCYFKCIALPVVFPHKDQQQHWMASTAVNLKHCKH